MCLGEAVSRLLEGDTRSAGAFAGDVARVFANARAYWTGHRDGGEAGSILALARHYDQLASREIARHLGAAAAAAGTPAGGGAGGGLPSQPSARAAESPQPSQSPQPSAAASLAVQPNTREFRALKVTRRLVGFFLVCFIFIF